MKKIMIDLDDTICTGGYLEVLNEYLGTNYTYDDLLCWKYTQRR